MGTYYKKKLLITGSFLLLCCTLFSQHKLSKTIEKTLPLTNVGELVINNKYGDISIVGWNKKQLKITIEIEVVNKKKDQATDLLKRIQPEIKAIGDFVSINTQIKEKSSSLFTHYFNKAIPFDYNKGNLQVNYLIYMPSNADLNITNKFGDVIIGEWIGGLKAKIQHGDLWINKNINNAHIELSFGKLQANNINYGKIQAKNSDINIDFSNNLTINSTGSTINLLDIKKLEFYSSKDETTIEKIATINGSINFGALYINILSNKINLDLKLVDLRVSNIDNKVADIKIDQESSDVNINILNFPCLFTSTLEQGLLRLPKSFYNINSKVINKSKRIREISATYGQQALGSISINGLKGVILLKE